ncbi:Rap1a/Tai family immunity protein [Pseudomonadota bacterium]
MKLIRYLVALTAATASTLALAAVPPDQKVITTEDLIELCSVSADDPAYPAAMGFCLGYIDAAMDYHAALTAGPKYDPIACPETAVTREEVVVVLMDWSKRNTQHLKSEAPVVGVMRASAEKWPCS